MNRNGSTTIGSDVEDRIDSLKDSAAQIKDRVIEVKDEAMDRGNALLDSGTEYIKENPLKSVAIAFGIGYIAMRLFR